jgi:type IV secretory pathway VirB3-like protein
MPAEALDKAPLYLAATRPAMIPWLGVPYSAGVVLIAAAGIIVIYGQNPVYLIALGPVWVALIVLVRHDHNALRVVDKWSRTSLVAVEAGLWGGASPNPAPLRRNKKMPARGVPHAV